MGFFFRGNSGYSRNKYGFSAAGAELEDVWFFLACEAAEKKDTTKGGGGKPTRSGKCSRETGADID